jgi:hypothetical protein
MGGLEQINEKLTSFIVRRILSNFIHQGSGGTPVFMGKYFVYTRLDFIFRFHLIESKGGYSVQAMKIEKSERNHSSIKMTTRISGYDEKGLTTP